MHGLMSFAIKYVLRTTLLVGYRIGKCTINVSHYLACVLVHHNAVNMICIETTTVGKLINEQLKTGMVHAQNKMV
jgi:hypothetical protein